MGHSKMSEAAIDDREFYAIVFVEGYSDGNQWAHCIKFVKYANRVLNTHDEFMTFGSRGRERKRGKWAAVGTKKIHFGEFRKLLLVEAEIEFTLEEIGYRL